MSGAPAVARTGGRVVATRPGAVVVVPSRSQRVGAAQRALWDAKGWTPTVSGGWNAYEGLYQVRDRAAGVPRRFRGRVVVAMFSLKTYIDDPPASIRRHSKGPCFALVGDSWFRVHWQRAPRDVDEAILYVEQVLDEAINGANAE